MPRWPMTRRRRAADRRPAAAAAAAITDSRLAAAVARACGMESLESRVLMSAGTTWYVATTGADNNPGTLADPFRTIQQAANLARPGDVVLIRGGIYRETVRPVRSGTAADPITYKPYGNENVVVSGADVIAGWSNHTGRVFKARQSWDLGFGNNQVFVDGRMMVEARWPNTTLDLSHPVLAGADSISPRLDGDDSSATLRDGALTMPDGYWTGATIHIAPGHAWVAQTGKVTSYKRGQLNYDYEQMSTLYEVPEGGDQYYLTGKFQALDAPTEWFRDPDGSLYLWAPDSDSPAGHMVEAKRREYAFNLNGRSFVNLEGLGIFAATIGTDASSHDIHMGGLDARYVSHFTLMPRGWDTRSSGLELHGHDITLEDSVIAWSAGNGVWVQGDHNTVRNNVIHDTGYQAGTEAGVLVRDTDHLITRNTIYNVGRSGIKHSRAPRTDITYNLIHDVMLQTTDGGGTYTYGTDGQGAEVAYNIVYGVNSGGFGAAGVYLDNFSSHWNVHHNVVFDANYGVKMNPTSRYNQIVSNTLMGTDYAVASSKDRDMLGSVFRNNIFGAPTQIGPTASVKSNLSASTDPRFVDAADQDFRLRDDSPAIDRGDASAPFAGSYGGSAPDLGAYESGRTPFKAGAGSGSADGVPQPHKPPTTPTPTPTPAPDPDDSDNDGGNSKPPPTPVPVQAARNARLAIQVERNDGTHGTHANPYGLDRTDTGDWVKLSGVDFGPAGVASVTMRLAVDGGYGGRRIEIRSGSPAGTLHGTVTTKATGGWWTFTLQSANVTGLKGVKDIYLVFQGGTDVANIDWVKFSSAPIATKPTSTPVPPPPPPVVQPAAKRNGRSTIEAESYDAYNNVAKRTRHVGMTYDGSWLKFDDVDFGSAGVGTMTAHLAVGNESAGRKIEVRLGNPTGAVVGTLVTKGTGGWGWDRMGTQSATITGLHGVQDVYLVFKGGAGVANLDWVRFS